MSEKKIRITKAMRFEDIKALLNGEEPTYGTTLQDALDVLDHELGLLAKKNNADNKKLTANQQANEGYMALILDYLDIQTEGATCGDMIKHIEQFDGFSTSKVSALTSKLVAMGKLERCKGEKGKTLFKKIV